MCHYCNSNDFYGYWIMDYNLGRYIFVNDTAFETNGLTCTRDSHVRQDKIPQISKRIFKKQSKTMN